MNAEQLLVHYERIAEAPDAIARLRRFVLDLAMRGKLVEQDAAEGTAAELLKHIISGRPELDKLMRKKTDARVGNVAADAAPFAIPASWRWTLFADLVAFSAGRTPARADLSYWNSGEHAWVSIADMEDGGVVSATKETVSQKAKAAVFKSNPSPEGTIIMSFKLTIGKISRLAIPAFHNEAIISIFPHLSEMDSFLFHLLPLLARSGEIKGAIKGATLNRESISNILVPLPPLSEQHRIVAKVDELMALCDRLEAARKEREASRDRLVSASLARLTAPDPDPAIFAAHARFALDNLTKLSSQHRQVAQWRATIIELAARGKLSFGDANDTPPAQALEAIDDTRDALVRAKLLRREKPLTAVRAEEIPFQAPSSWLWARLGDIALFTQYGTSLKAEQSTTGVPVLTMGNIQSGAVVSAKEKRIPSQSSGLPELYLKKFDLLYNRTNSPELVGKTGIYLGRDDCVTFASYLIRLRFVTDRTDPHFINLAMNAPGFRSSQIAPYIKQQTGQANVNGTAMKNMLIALPPIEEQRRIVAKVDELMALCDRLETCLATGDETRQRLLEAIVHEALEPAEQPELEVA